MSAAEPPFVPLADTLLSTDVSAFVLFTVAGIYAALWARDREPGLLWLSAGFGAIGFGFATSRWYSPDSIYITQQGFFLIAPTGLMLLTVGLVRYLQLPARMRTVAMVLMVAFPVVSLLITVASSFVPIQRVVAAFVVSLQLSGLAALVFWAARHERGVALAVVGLALLSIPFSSGLALMLGADPLLVRRTASLPLILFGLVLLTVSLLRRRRALEAEVARRGAAEAELAVLNTSLEQQVAQRTAELQDMVAGLESFNRSVSHDLRGPLGGIAGLALLAEAGLQRGDSAPALRMLPLIREQSESSMQLVAALLELARVGDAPMHRHAVDLGALATDVARLLSEERPGTAQAQVTVGALPTVIADEALLRAVFTNLIGNGLKFCAQRAEGRIEVRSRSEGGAVIIEVADNGEGFDNASAASLFKPFRRLHGARFDGHGVGLSIVRRAVERHGGRVWAQGQPSQGATFSFSLPPVA